MSLFEWIGECFNPGPIGSIKIGKKEKISRTNGIVLLRLILALIITAAMFYYAFTKIFEFNFVNVFIGVEGFTIYLIVSYFVRPKSDVSNIGWFGGLMGHPFRISDDINRFILFLEIILWPGSFIAESLWEGSQLSFKK